MRDAGWLPWTLGGPLTFEQAFSEVVKREIPFGSPPQAVVTYGLWCAGYHYSELIRHLFFSKHQSDFAEMMLHHICAVSLLAGYLWANFHCLGVYFAVLHDCVDSLIALARMLQATKYKKTISAFFFVVMWFVWLYTRILVLPASIWGVVYYTLPYLQTLEHSNYFVPYLQSMAFFLSCMCFLHYYWFVLISQMLSAYIFKGELKDIVRKVEDPDKKTS